MAKDTIKTKAGAAAPAETTNVLQSAPQSAAGAGDVVQSASPSVALPVSHPGDPRLVDTPFGAPALMPSDMETISTDPREQVRVLLVEVGDIKQRFAREAEAATTMVTEMGRLLDLLRGQVKQVEGLREPEARWPVGGRLDSRNANTPTMAELFEGLVMVLAVCGHGEEAVRQFAQKVKVDRG